jgi:hypothetical protein
MPSRPKSLMAGLAITQSRGSSDFKKKAGWRGAAGPRSAEEEIRRVAAPDLQPRPRSARSIRRATADAAPIDWDRLRRAILLSA